MDSSRLTGLPFTRRRLLTATAAGVSVMTLGPAGRALAQGEAVRWVSPRGTLEVVDDWAYWVAKKYGYFGDIETTIEPGPLEATANWGWRAWRSTPPRFG